MEAKLDMVLEQVGRDKNIDKSVLINALEQAILTAAKRTFGMNREMEAKFNPETGSVDLFLIVNVVDEDDAIEGREITVAEAHKAGLEADLAVEQGKAYLIRGEYGEAVMAFRVANRHRKSLKLTAITWLARLAPKMLLKHYKNHRAAEIAFVAKQN